MHLQADSYLNDFIKFAGQYDVDVCAVMRLETAIITTS